MMKIRKCKKSDLRSVFAVYQLARTAACFQQEPAADFQDFKSIVEDEKVYAAVDGERIIAFISVYPPQSFVHHLYVLPEYRRQGIGEALVECVRDIFDSPLSLKCETANKAALEFYKKTGWNLFDKGSEKDGTEYILLTLDFE